MKTLIDFDSIKKDASVAHSGQEIPKHTQETLENYFIRGYMPGGFLTACLVGDLYRAVATADTANRQMLWCIVRWIMNNAPDGSWGSAQAMRDWARDKNGHRTQFREQAEKSKVWLTLVKK